MKNKTLDFNKPKIILPAKKWMLLSHSACRGQLWCIWNPHYNSVQGHFSETLLWTIKEDEIRCIFHLSKITFSFSRAMEIRASDKDPLMVFGAEIGKILWWAPEMDWKFTPLLCRPGSIALSCRSDLGLTPSIERLALVSLASFTISRKLYPALT